MPTKARTMGTTTRGDGSPSPSSPLEDHPIGEGTKSHGSQLSPLKQDLGSILLLLFLYTLQGIPLGLASAVPLLLQEKKVSYTQQAMFSLSVWPFSLKLLWAPLVDAIYLPSFGRRKSWLIPTQLIIGAFMFWLGSRAEDLLGEGMSTPQPDVPTLTYGFFVLYTLTATQDIAVDGWALTMLSRKNVGYASTCNTIGQTVGYLIAFVILLAFNSSDFCNRFLRAEPQDMGMLTLGDFMMFWGVVFVVSTILVAIFKSEKNFGENDEEDLTVGQAYMQMYRLCQLPAIMKLSAILLTCRVAFGAADSITQLKLQEKGIPKDTFGILVIAIAPLNIFVTSFFGSRTSGPKPFTFFLQAYPWRLLMGVAFAALVWAFPTDPSEIGWGFYIAVIVSIVVHQVASNIMFVCQMGFFARVSDPAFGGIYMTFLNTVTNLGAKWPTSIALSLVDTFTWKQCISKTGQVVALGCDVVATANSTANSTACANNDGVCEIKMDGFIVLSALCTVLGVLWIIVAKSKVIALEELNEREWIVSDRRRD